MTDIVYVLLPRLLDEPFSYRVPSVMDVSVGDVVRVPLGRQMAVGVVWSYENEKASSVPEHKIKEIDSCVENIAFTPIFMEFIDWVARYTMSPRGMVLKMAMSVSSAFEPVKLNVGYVLREGQADEFQHTKARKKVLDVVSDGLVRSPSDIALQAGVSISVVKGLAASNVLEEKPMKAEGLHTVLDIEAMDVPALSDHQSEAAEVLCDAVDEAVFNVTLLDGVTGSGKTEVYFAAIEKALRQDEGQVLVLLPEIVLTAQFIGRFKCRFGFKPEIWHSMVSSARRRDVWRGVAQGTVRLVVGARSALFLPFPQLSLVIIDEEHEAAFKQEEGVHYHARDMAIMRAQKEQFPLVLASATPSVETMVNVQSGRYDYVQLPVRHGGVELPKVHVIDMRKEPKDNRNWISLPLRKQLKEVYESEKQTLLFLNRRGYAPLTLCRSCGERFACHQCSSWLVEHREGGHPVLQCHHCGFRAKMFSECPHCQADSDSFVACGPGVERLVDEVRRFLPDARVAQMTSDSVSTAKKAKQLVHEITDRQWDVVVGTQMIAKGHHFPHLSLVGVVDADLGLAGGDLRAGERTYQLLHQVAGRAGRECGEGVVYLQSYMPGNAVVQALCNGDRDAFCAHEIESRQICSMPPFSRLVAMIISSSSEFDAQQSASLLARYAMFGDAITVLGPSPAPMYKIRQHYRYRLLIKAPKSVNIQAMIARLLDQLPRSKGVSIRVDVDPYSFS